MKFWVFALVLIVLTVEGSRYNQYNHDDIDSTIEKDVPKNTVQRNNAQPLPQDKKIEQYTAASVVQNKDDLNVGRVKNFESRDQVEDEGWHAASRSKSEGEVDIVADMIKTDFIYTNEFQVGFVLSLAAIIFGWICIGRLFNKNKSKNKNVKKIENEEDDDILIEEDEKLGKEQKKEIKQEKKERKIENEGKIVVQEHPNPIRTGSIDGLREDIANLERAITLMTGEQGNTMSLIDKQMQVVQLKIQVENMRNKEEENLLKARQIELTREEGKRKTQLLEIRKQKIQQLVTQKYYDTLQSFSIWPAFVVYLLWQARGLGPNELRKYLNLENYLPWWFPKAILAPITPYLIPILIIVGLLAMLLVIIVTRGNTIATFIVLFGISLVFIWNVEHLTISSGCFIVIRLLSYTALHYFLCIILFDILNYVFDLLRAPRSIKVILNYTLTFLALLSSCYVGFYIASHASIQKLNEIEHFVLFQLDAIFTNFQ